MMQLHPPMAWITVAVAVLTVVQPARAQAVLTGRVLAEVGRRPLPGAEVAIPTLGRSALADSLGSVRITGVPPGTYELLVQRPGYEPMRVRALFAAGDTIRADFVLRRSAQPLPEVAVTRPAATVAPRMVEFERRRAAGFGTFLTREALEQREHSKLSDVLRGAPGLRFIYRDKGGVAVANNHYAGPPGGGRGPRQCYMQIFVDGVRVFEPSQLRMAGMDPPDINHYTVGTIEGIEIYPGPAETPPEFGGTNAMCGTVVIWTRSG